jgi:hypothetical protein
MSKNSEDVSTPVKETLFRSPFGRLLLLEENLVFGFLETIEPLVAPLSSSFCSVKALPPSRDRSGPDRIRTCDPALIKRML